MVTSAIKLPDRLSLYFDTHNSPLNPRNNGQVYSYGTLPLFLTRLTGEWLDRGCGDSPSRLRAAIGSLLVKSLERPCSPDTFTTFHSALVGRMWSALADLGVLILIYLICHAQGPPEHRGWPSPWQHSGLCWARRAPRPTADSLKPLILTEVAAFWVAVSAFSGFSDTVIQRSHGTSPRRAVYAQ